MLGIIIVLGAMVMGGLMPVWGIRLAPKLGKRDSPWFGLRPKYTSIMVTIFQGHGFPSVLWQLWLWSMKIDA